MVEGRKLNPQDQLAASPVPEIIDARRRPRFKIQVDLCIHSRTCGVLKGYTVDLSESGISAMLRLEVPLGEIVELDFTLPFGPVNIQAVVRQRNAFRYGFQFLESGLTNEIIRSTCRKLGAEQSTISPDSQ
jgi:hypothetical protein